MSDIEFGDDDGREDQFNTPLDPDPEQVTIRYHDERVLFGPVNLGMWHDLDEDNRAIARVIGYALLTRLLAGDNAEAANSGSTASASTWNPEPNYSTNAPSWKP